MVTFRHERFIDEAIGSVLNQQTGFPIELVIGEDNSPDGTGDHIRRYADTANVRIRTRFNQVNLGAAANFEINLKECRGEYIALLEGDDYWTDPRKLQRQIEFLDANPEFSTCFHPVDIFCDGRIREDHLTRSVPDVSTIRDLAQGNYMHTCSVVFRAGLFDRLPEGFNSAPAGDLFLHMLNARHGPIKRLPQKMATYRIHDGGAWSSQKDVDLKILAYLEAMVGHFDDPVDEILKDRHRRTAFKSFVSRVEEPGAEARLQRCLRYGSAPFAQFLADFMRSTKRPRNGRLRGLVERVFGARTG